jgi:hypothetical protein
MLFGLRGESSAGYTRHGPLATFALSHFPTLYNPDPEIYRERTLRRETGAHGHAMIAWPSQKEPTKLLVRAGTTVVLPSVCGARPVTSLRTTPAGRDMSYWDEPFACSDAR